jgi:hypothetical protein
MRLILLSIIVTFLVSCNKRVKTEIPEQFVGEWTFDEDAAYDGIEKMDIAEEDKIKLSSSYINMVRGQTMRVYADGWVSGSMIPDNLLRFEYVSESTEGVILRTVNQMNSEEHQYTLNSISDGIWRVQILDSNHKPIKSTPDDYWRFTAF